MRVKYFRDTDTLNIMFTTGPYRSGYGEDTNDPDITLLYDEDERLTEIEIERASDRINLAEVRALDSFDEHGPALDVKAIREKTGLSQAEFAARLNISPRTLQNWEQSHRQPTGPAVQLLRLARRDPMLFVQVLEDAPA